jgi:hypothetical protein
MAGHKGSGTALALAVVLGGCAGVPSFDIVAPITVEQIVDQVQCEIGEAARKFKRLAGPEGWRAVADLSLNVEDNLALTPTVTFTEPLPAPPIGETLTFGLSAALRGQRQRIYSEKLEIVVAPLAKRFCDRAPDKWYDLTGNLGIVEIAEIAMRSHGADDPAAQFTTKDAFGTTVQFIITKGVSGVGPSWRLVRFSGPGGVLATDRRDTHKLIISFAPTQILQTVTETVREETPAEARRLGAPATRRVTRTRVVRARPGTPGAAESLNFKMLLESLPPGTLR